MRRIAIVDFDSCYKCPFHAGGMMSASYCRYETPSKQLFDMNGDNYQINEKTKFPDWCRLEVVQQ